MRRRGIGRHPVARNGGHQPNKRRNPSRVINERRDQRIFGALVNFPVEDKPLSAFSSSVVGESGCVRTVAYYD